MARPARSEPTSPDLVEVPARPEPAWELEATEPQQVLGRDPRARGAGLLEAAAAPPPELARLLRYHQVDYDSFAPQEARYFAALSEHLRRAGAVGAGEQVDRATFEAAVGRFQRSAGLSEDGVPGQDCCRVKDGWW